MAEFYQFPPFEIAVKKLVIAMHFDDIFLKAEATADLIYYPEEAKDPKNQIVQAIYQEITSAKADDSFHEVLYRYKEEIKPFLKKQASRYEAHPLYE